MMAVHWASDANGSFSAGANWLGGEAPGAADDAVLDAPGGAPYSVQASGVVTVAGVQSNADATLEIDGGIFTASAASDGGAMAGSITLLAGARLDMAGILVNQGKVSIGSDGSAAALDLQGDLLLEGGGTIVLGGAKTAMITSSLPHKLAILTNLDNTISGAGVIGKGMAQIVNDQNGVILANGRKSLSTAAFMLNYGTLESAGKSELVLGGDEVENMAGGSLYAGGSSTIIVHSQMVGGELTSSALGSIILDNAYVVGIASSATIICENTSTIKGGIDNSNSLTVASHANLRVDVGVTLSGGGLLALAGSTIYSPGSPATLTNIDNTVSGSGFVELTSITNEASGYIVAQSGDELVVAASSI